MNTRRESGQRLVGNGMRTPITADGGTLVNNLMAGGMTKNPTSTVEAQRAIR